jgi:predicted transcriptional regulator
LAKLTGLGALERAVMDQLWDLGEPQTVPQIRDDRAHRYAALCSRDDLVAGLMVDALDQAAGSGGRRTALMNFVERVGADEADVLRRALADLEATHQSEDCPPDG